MPIVGLKTLPCTMPRMDKSLSKARRPCKILALDELTSGSTSLEDALLEAEVDLHVSHIESLYARNGLWLIGSAIALAHIFFRVMFALFNWPRPC